MRKQLNRLLPMPVCFLGDAYHASFLRGTPTSASFAHHAQDVASGTEQKRAFSPWMLVSNESSTYKC